MKQDELLKGTKYEGATEGEWLWGQQKYSERPVGSLYAGNTMIMDLGDETTYYPSPGTMPEHPEKKLIADAKLNAARVQLLAKALRYYVERYDNPDGDDSLIARMALAEAGLDKEPA